MVYIKTYIFDHFYQQCSVLLTMVPRKSKYLVYFCLLCSKYVLLSIYTYSVVYTRYACFPLCPYI